MKKLVTLLLALYLILSCVAFAEVDKADYLLSLRQQLSALFFRPPS